MFGKFEELLVILVIILVLFGGKKLPGLARSIGASVREVRKGFSGDDTGEVVQKSKSQNKSA
jgi:sec-independent protein translocase protein TatA